jgi:tungstate transport system ATP-binding protein
MSDALLEIINLSHSYGNRRVLEGLNLNVRRGEVFTVIGPTGAGKTTLLRLIDLLEVPSSGDIYFDGRRVPEKGRERLQIRRRLSFVLQKPQLFNESVYDNICCGLKWRGEKEDGIKRKVERVLEMVGLEKHRHRNARTLSGGEAQRVALARALVVEPDVLLLDEPTANLDPLSAAKIESLISHLAAQRDITMIIATHDMSQGWQLADRVGVLLEGKFIQIGGPDEVFRLPRNEKVASFVGVENVLEGKVLESNQGIALIEIRGEVIQGVCEYPVDTEVWVCLRPEDVTLSLARIQSSARNCFPAKVIRVISSGPLSRVEVESGHGLRLVALVTRISAEEMDLVEGKEVHVSFKATGAHIIEKGLKS